jgi:Bax protein
MPIPKPRVLWIMCASAAFLVAITMIGHAAPAESLHFATPLQTVEAPRTAVATAHVFDERGYTLDAVFESGVVPRIFVQDIPLDLASIQRVQEKKDLFLRILVPLVLKANEEISVHRARLVELAGEKSDVWSAKDRQWIDALARAYDAPPDDLNGLLERVDVVPPSLGLAQGIDESGWGTSRFAREGESLFGQHAPADGVRLDAARAEGVGVAAFDGMLDSVQAYFHNLNSTRAYHGLRAKRAEARAAGRLPTGSALVAGLASYSERGSEYVRELESILHANRLGRYDSMRLASKGGATLVLASEGRSVDSGAGGWTNRMSRIEHDIVYGVLFFVSGLVSGFAGGLFGIGGGTLRVPIFLYLFAAFGAHAAVGMHMAAGTSLALAIPTGVQSALAQRRAGHLDMPFLRSWLPGLILGVGLGLAVMRVVSSTALVLTFAVAMLLIAFRMLVLPTEARLTDQVPGRPIRDLLSMGIGTASTMIGISGGAFTTPTLMLFGYPIRRAIAISAAGGAAIATIGAVGSILNGIDQPGRLAWSWGYVDLLAVVAVLPGILISAPLGVALGNHLDERRLRITFGLLLLAVSADMFRRALA